MRLATLALFSLAAAAAAPVFAADDPVSGAWKVHGKISGFSFDLICKLERKGDAIGGTCYDGGTNKPHPLIRGSISGDHVSWTYQSNYLLNKFDANYSGLLSGTTIKGEVTAPGHNGTFSAEKQT